MACAGRFRRAVACAASSRCAPCARTSAGDRDGGRGGTAPAPDHRALAKPILPIDGRAVVATLLHQLAAEGIGRSRSSPGIWRSRSRRSLDGLELRFVRQPAPDGSADAVRRALEAGAGLPALVTAADTLSARRPGPGGGNGLGGDRVPAATRASPGSRSSRASSRRSSPTIPGCRSHRRRSGSSPTRSTSTAFPARRSSFRPRFSRRSTRESRSQRSRSAPRGISTEPADLVRENFPYLGG